MSACPHGDRYCPCQDGDACHYEGDRPARCLTSGQQPCTVHQSPPRRRWRLELDLDADSLHDLAAALEEIAFEAQTDKLPAQRVSGGDSVGYVLNLSHDPNQTAEKFASANAAYVRSRRAQEATR